MWTDSSLIVYDNWGPNQPDLPQGGCVQFSFTDSLWYDVACEETVKAICRISLREYTLQCRTYDIAA